MTDSDVKTATPAEAVAGIRFSEFVRVHGLSVETFSTCDLNRGGRPARGAQFRLNGKSCEVREGAMLGGVFAIGLTDEEATAALPMLYAGKALRFGARVGHHSETDPECVKIQCPATWAPGLPALPSEPVKP